MGMLFSGPPKPPKPPPPQPIPDVMDPAQQLASRRRLLEGAAARSGRASTMLTGEGDYAGSKLGTL